jgi:hypothetical protein
VERRSRAKEAWDGAPPSVGGQGLSFSWWSRVSVKRQGWKRLSEPTWQGTWGGALVGRGFVGTRGRFCGQVLRKADVSLALVLCLSSKPSF